MVEGARLESVYTLIAYRGFESLRLRHLRNTKTSFAKTVFCVRSVDVHCRKGQTTGGNRPAHSGSFSTGCCNGGFTVSLNVRIVVALIALLSGVSVLKAGDAFPVVAPPSCVNNVGETVVFNRQSQAGGQFAAGRAFRAADGSPRVMGMNYDQAPPVFQAFIDRHECAHHEVGDVDRPHPPRNSPAHLMNEAIADCVAILKLRDEWGDDTSQLPALKAALSADMAAIGFPPISIESRWSNIQNCHDRYGSAEGFIAGVLADRGLE